MFVLSGSKAVVQHVVRFNRWFLCARFLRRDPSPENIVDRTIFLNRPALLKRLNSLVMLTDPPVGPCPNYSGLSALVHGVAFDCLSCGNVDD